MNNKIFKTTLCLISFTTFSLTAQQTTSNNSTSTQIKKSTISDHSFLINNLFHTNKEIGEYKVASGSGARKSAIALVSLIPTLWMGYKLANNNAPFLAIDQVSQHQFEWNKIWDIKNITFSEVLEVGQHTILPTLCYCVPVFITSYFLLNKLHKAVANKNTTISNAQLLTSYVKKWETYKKLTPVQFHDQFDHLYKLYLNDKLGLDEFEATKIIGNIVRESVASLQK